MDVRDFGNDIQPMVFETSGSIRFVVMNTVDMEIIQQLKIQKVVDRFDKNEDNPLYIEFCQSSEKKLSKQKFDPNNKEIKDDTEVKYQIIQFDQKVQMAMIDEISLKTSVDWDLSKKTFLKPVVKIQRTGMKFIQMEPIDEEFL